MPLTLPPVSRIALFGSLCQNDRRDGLEHLLMALRKGGIAVYAESGFKAYLESMGIESVTGIPQWTGPDTPVDAALSIGGDGTFLRSARRLGGTGIPICGINTGHLGFLAHFTLEDTDLLVALLTAGGAPVEDRMVLRVESPSIPPALWPYALNEVAILKEETSSMIKVSMEIDGCFLADYLADGVVISTPTGSTAYNLAAGGPLIEPTLRCMAISPVAPHTLTLRPLVVSGEAFIKALTTSRASHYRVSLDGCSFRMERDTEISICRAPFGIPVILRPGEDFAYTLRHKLLWARR
ncbi:MAG: NAD(+)/NADH kinase [Muribaculaceae bacterium]|nr:NAD(+)/NADH kinase [Muribaculaceae bacterium]